MRGMVDSGTQNNNDHGVHGCAHDTHPYIVLNLREDQSKQNRQWYDQLRRHLHQPQRLMRDLLRRHHGVLTVDRQAGQSLTQSSRAVALILIVSVRCQVQRGSRLVRVGQLVPGPSFVVEERVQTTIITQLTRFFSVHASPDLQQTLHDYSCKGEGVHFIDANSTHRLSSPHWQLRNLTSTGFVIRAILFLTPGAPFNTTTATPKPSPSHAELESKATNYQSKRRVRDADYHTSEEDQSLAVYFLPDPFPSPCCSPVNPYGRLSRTGAMVRYVCVGSSINQCQDLPSHHFLPASCFVPASSLLWVLIFLTPSFFLVSPFASCPVVSSSSPLPPMAFLSSSHCESTCWNSSWISLALAAFSFSCFSHARHHLAKPFGLGVPLKRECRKVDAGPEDASLC
ncbi:hypothetical protein KCU88_g4, partial [Aureobasidium melanogenum]